MPRRRASDDDVRRVLSALLRNDALNHADPIIAERTRPPLTLAKKFSESELKLVVGERIRETRRQKRWARADLARAADLSETHVARLESGTAGLSFFVAARVARALGIPLDVLVRRDG